MRIIIIHGTGGSCRRRGVLAVAPAQTATRPAVASKLRQNPIKSNFQCRERKFHQLRASRHPWWGAGRTLINSIDPGTAFRVSFPLSGEQQERRDLFRSPSVQA
jgi:hypothetical protein